MSDSPSNPNLEYLENRWRRNPGSRIYLQLAEEYRRLDRHQDAVEVLTRGLAERSNDLSGWVVLGRCQLEVGAPDDAASALEKVLARDPAHMVANKLMVETQLQRGDAERAQERLGFYRLINDRDPEIDHLEYRLSQIKSAEPESSTPTAVEITPPSVAPESTSQDRSTAVPAATQENDGLLFDLGGGAPTEVALNLPSVAPSSSTRNGQPFGDLPALDEAAHWRQLAEGGLFSEDLTVSFGSTPAGDAEPQPPSPKVELSPDVEPAPKAEPTSDQPTRTPEPFDLSASLKGMADDASESLLDSAEAASVPSFEALPDPPSTNASVGNQPERESDEAGLDLGDLALIGAAAGAAAAVVTTGAAAEESTESSGADLVDASAFEVADATPPSRAAEALAADDAVSAVDDDAVPATVAMGHLYLEQGHHHEAETVFRRVLATEPDNAEAQQGLDRVVEIEAGLRNVSGETASSDRSSEADVEAREPASLGGESIPPVAEAEVVAEADPEPEVTLDVAVESDDTEPDTIDTFGVSHLLRGESLPEGLTARKIVALQRYLSLIQQGRDHVS